MLRAVVVPLLLGCLAGLASAAPTSPPVPAAQATGWSGPAPGSRLPTRAEALAAREACRLGHEHVARPLPGPAEAAREDDPLTWTDVRWYALDIGVASGEDHLDGTVTMHLASRVDGLDELRFHAAANLSLGNLTVDGQWAAWIREGDLIRVPLASPLDEGDVVELLVHYQADYDGCGVLSRTNYNVQTNQTIHTITTQAEPFDARCWWPCKDDTRDKADSVRVRVTTDDFNSVVSNGVLRSDVDNLDGTHTVTWAESWPIVTYLVSICVTEYNHAQATWTWEGIEMPMHDWSWGLSAGDQQYVLEAGLSALTTLSDSYGAYPFHDEKYGHAQYTWGGAMEHQTCSSMGFYNEAVVAHELAHQWFGDKITCDTFHHIWLNEGWATYSEAVHFERLLGQDALHEYMDYEEYTGPGTIYVENPESDNIFDGNLSYSKGSWVVHMLRHVMGEEAFWQAVRDYQGPNERPSHRTADTDEFRAFMEARHGSSLQWFFDEWIHGEYFPEYEYFWGATPGGTPGSWWLDLGLLQAQAGERQTFTMPVDCRVTFAGGQSETITLFNDQVAQDYTHLFDAQPLAVEIDPEDWILGPATELAQLPPTDVRVSALRATDLAGQPIDRLPVGGEFLLQVELENRGAASGGLTVSLGGHPDLTLPPALSRPPLVFGGHDELELAVGTLDGIGGLIPLTVTVAWEGGSGQSTLTLPAGTPELLLVDDDGGDSYEDWYLEAAAGALDAQLVTPDALPGNLAEYPLLVWFTGDNRRALDDAEWVRLAAYQNGGGHLVLTGQDFCEAQDPMDLSSVCGVEVLDSLYDNNAVSTTQEGIFGGSRLYLFSGGAGNQERMDVIFGVVDCMAPQANYYNTSFSAGEELICGEGGLLTLGFGLEGIADIGNGMNLQEALLALRAWSRGETALDPAAPTRPGPVFELVGAHPNPFNPSTTLNWQAGRPGRLEGAVYNLAGQRVAEFAPRQVAAGQGRLDWTAAGQASGLYVARLSLTGADGARHDASLKLMLLQ